MKIILLIINQNADSFIDNQNQNDYQIIIDNFYQITPLTTSANFCKHFILFDMYLTPKWYI
eukprot:snap_masked-scaffold_15-processed-gene-5.33-mRNA-1 protein AED:1.00 eAED:1.00 QI:0/0/0/0/1/1/2/0/60